MPLKSAIEERPIRLDSDERLDFDRPAPFRKAYFVASSYRSGSTYLCWRLWETGLLGAPAEALNPMVGLRLLTNRFKTTSAADYITKLLAHRTSRNGVFGMKAHFHHFEAFLKDYPALLEVLSPLTFIYINRSDKVAQAVSMAKALQTNWWSSRSEEGPAPPLQYDRDLIANCLKEIEVQDLAWPRWFEARNITPHRLTYEALTADADETVRSIVELLGVQNDEPTEVHVPPALKQGDETNEEWIERFRLETKVGGEHADGDGRGVEPSAVVADAGSPQPTRSGHFCDRYHRLAEDNPARFSVATSFLDMIRLRRRYDAIILQNRELFRDARVLDIMSSHGFWSLAALDAGAAHVVGVDPTRERIEAAERNFNEYGVQPKSYEFIQSGIFAAIKRSGPEAFDVVLCKGFFELCHFPEFFQLLSRLRPKHVILDTGIAPGFGPSAHFAVTTGRNSMILATPNHQLVTFLCQSEFRWRLIDWQAMGVTDWTGIQDYARDRRRTYVLDRLP
jgi:LPS sulfotransferase NodH/2-polyprenyl-3-methyl-5-hydroxy-6-metoxy-1,4-benzoquinol methylase